MLVKILSESENTIGLLGIGLSYGKSSGLNFEDILNDKSNHKELLKSLYDVSLKLKDLDGGENKFLRQLTLAIDTQMPLFWWREFDTYKIGTTAQSESTMHSITKEPFCLEQFQHDFMSNTGLELLSNTIDKLNEIRDKYLNETDKHRKKTSWYDIISNLPDSWLQRRIVTLNYAVLQNIISKRKKHKLYEWRYFCKTIYENVKHPEYLRTQFGIC